MAARKDKPTSVVRRSTDIDDTESWAEWRRYVLMELERMNECYDSLKTEAVNLKVEIAMLKVKSGIWGAVGAAVPIIILLAIQFLTKT